jgi:hypothetical protein
MGKAHGLGPDGARSFYSSALTSFYRSVHMNGGHTIEIDDADHAHGVLYCKAEHEIDDSWVVQAIAYADTYERVDGTWLFVKRVPNSWYAADGKPTGPGFNDWPGSAPRTPPALPHTWPTWDKYWRAAGPEAVNRATKHPTSTQQPASPPAPQTR